MKRQLDCSIDTFRKLIIYYSEERRLFLFYFFFRKTVLEYGMFDQIRVDCGKEFYLYLGMQEIYRNLRNDQTIAPYRQTQSKKVQDISNF